MRSRAAGGGPDGDPDRYLRTDHVVADLRQSSVRGSVFTMGAQVLRFALQLGSTAVLARLLTPADFGLVAMVLAVTGFVAIFRTAGLATATVQRAELNHRQVSTLFWVNATISVVVMGAVAAAAPLLAWFYDEPRLVPITLVLSTTFMITGFNAQHYALLLRQMRFGALVSLELVALAVSVTVGIASACLGAGYWALVAMPPAEVITATIGVWIVSKWRPGPPVRGSGVRPMIEFGLKLAGSRVLGYASASIDNVLVGWAWGAGALGLYSKGFQLLNLPAQQIAFPVSRVAVPALSRLQDDAERFRRYYRKLLENITFVVHPAIVLLLVAADDVILLVLGSDWIDTAPIFRALTPAALVASTAFATRWVYITTGRTGRQLRWRTVEAAGTLVAVLATLPWGPVGVACGISAQRLLLRVPGLLYCFSGSPVRLGDFWSATWRSLAASAVAAIAVLASKTLGWAADVTPFVGLVVSGLVCAGAYLGAFALLPGGRERVSETLNVLMQALRDVREGEPEGGDDDRAQERRQS